MASTQLVRLKDPGSLLIHDTLPVGLCPVTLTVQTVAFPIESGFGLQVTDVLVGTRSRVDVPSGLMSFLAVGEIW